MGRIDAIPSANERGAGGRIELKSGSRWPVAELSADMPVRPFPEKRAGGVVGKGEVLIRVRGHARQKHAALGTKAAATVHARSCMPPHRAQPGRNNAGTRRGTVLGHASETRRLRGEFRGNSLGVFLPKTTRGCSRETPWTAKRI